MATIPFDVNDSRLREIFITQHLVDCIAHLDENVRPLWGKMTPQHMTEHLIWTFECSTGTLTLPCRTPENLLERAKRFLYDNRPTPHDFKNPLIGENLLPFRFHSFEDARNALLKEKTLFIDHFHKQPNAVHVHPVFGPLGAEEWQRSHFKHCYHHLQQFGLIN